MKIDRVDQPVLLQTSWDDEVLANVRAAGWDRERFVHFQDQIRFTQWPTIRCRHRSRKIFRVARRFAVANPNVQQ